MGHPEAFGSIALPTRWLVDAPRAQRHGARLHRLGRWLLAGDPLADEVVTALAELPARARNDMLDRALHHGVAAVAGAPPALVRLCAHVEHVPFWFDRERADRGGGVFLRTG